MSIPFVYTQYPLTDLGVSVISLNGEESFHLAKVLRIRPGSKVILTDGNGYYVECEVATVNSTETELKISGELLFSPINPYKVHIAIAPPKHPDRLEWFVEKAVETGINRITLILCEHSEKWNVKLPRLQRIMIAAMKQSQQSRLPQLDGPVAFNDLLTNAMEEEKYIGYCDGVTHSLTSLAQPGKNILVAIGPEGDFSPIEVENAVKKGFHPISLGPARLRTETAGLVASLTIHLVNHLKT